MAANTLEELHAFAKRLALKRTWFQPSPYPHYDLTPNKRALAVKLGAKELSSKNFIALLRGQTSKEKQ